MSAAWNRVALRKESVDRNFDTVQIIIVVVQSLSARRAWIEMIDTITQGVFNLVALRKESVDRNLAWHCISEDVSCRSPQGERG